MYNVVNIHKGGYGDEDSSSIDTSSFLTMPRANPIYVNQAGDSMEGPLDMKNNKIINIMDPENLKGFRNKWYVDKSEKRTKTYVDNSLTEKRKNVKTNIDNVFDQKLMAIKEPIRRESAK